MPTLIVSLSLALAACGDPGGAPAPDGSPSEQPSASPPVLYVPVADVDDRDPVARSGAAGLAVRCDGPVALGGTSGNFGGPGTGGATPQEGLVLFTEQSLFRVPRDGYRLAARDDERALFLYEVDGRARVAVVVALGEASDLAFHEQGWGVETFATCDNAEFALPSDDPVMDNVWRDADGDPVPTSEVSSHVGAEHCDWQSVTFLYLGERQFVRDPEGRMAAQSVTTYDGDTRLPDDAEDTGYRKDGVALWRVASGDAVYAVRGERVERWPALGEMFGCA